MTSASRITANRANARVSTGPRTDKGRRRSARNARRHGLRVPISAQPSLVMEVETLARDIAGPEAHDTIMELARRVAEAQVDLVRIRTARCRLLAEPGDVQQSEEGTPGEKPGDADIATLATRLLEAADQLRVFERYERSALARRRRAVWALDVAREQTLRAP